MELFTLVVTLKISELYENIFMCVCILLYYYVPDEFNLLPKYGDCMTPNHFHAVFFVNNIFINVHS